LRSTKKASGVPFENLLTGKYLHIVKFRGHHNNKAYRSTKRGKREEEVRRIAKKIENQIQAFSNPSARAKPAIVVNLL
jgi:hypothetical protein